CRVSVLGPVLHSDLVLAGFFKVELQQIGEAFFIIDQEDAFLCHYVCSRFALSMIVTRTPPVRRFLTSRLPPCNSIIFLETGRPSPVPMPVGLVVKNGS